MYFLYKNIKYLKKKNINNEEKERIFMSLNYTLFKMKESKLGVPIFDNIMYNVNIQ